MTPCRFSNTSLARTLGIIVCVYFGLSFCTFVIWSYRECCRQVKSARYLDNDVAVTWRGSGYKLLMRTNMSNIKKDGWVDDYLPPACRQRTYGNLADWPKASVIIAFCNNERLVDVLHTIHSVMQRSPPVLLKEVILVDDNSQKEEFGEIFSFYCASVFGDKVKITRSNTSVGLIKARLLGSRIATGDVLVSLDAHMEVQDTWLEALVWEIMKNRKTLASSALDWMLYEPEEGWTYRSGFSSFICIFGWDLGFGLGFSRPEIEKAWKKDNTMPLPSPCTVGTIWAMDRQFFIDIGELDDGMEKWGGENLDLAIRTWLFGGRAVQVPCSHAGHLERAKQRDYRLNWDKYTNKNYRRIVDVWFDEYRKYTFLERPDLENIDPGNITDRLMLKKRSIHNFTWFLDNVFPELGVYDRNTIGYGWLRNLGQNKCLQRMESEALSLWPCEERTLKRGLFLTNDGYLRTELQTWHATGKAIGSAIAPEGATGTYHENWLSQWIHWKDGPMLLYGADGQGAERFLCMEGYPNGTVSLQRCDAEKKNLSQHWQWKVYSPSYNAMMSDRATNPSKYHEEFIRQYLRWSSTTYSVLTRFPTTATVSRHR